ncbi:hypothetical protein A3A14_01490 [Candidatus Daviesbacteria bacterium RIFCSPLOWO2_01_FULL_43_38]|uniref:BrnT family toxin n=1 Tax=Candidatus Daviesbacteria bacterium RIFCSPHIGHO2_12_FULL_43_11 TaxID=1797780 RepID=A0A1F5K453_9BACT|nr:MAG: hypothetical protein A2874_01250 [Candidatus Daviesbacteria bacterium RIFCSPHIGHO2_01_FULL_43_17]OGE35687.1 MAG: hypothetical protein A3E45_05290 [Candidatus Daviesbacteria bacterium RIFCSPHIGHO2_12_FULL_43_11]OGE63869.1 MAG: hypothetical protein A3A14_01490 [Candidatus Daviesbacteria bacterium RIFCSPLOWO2_01_FULL_43_38]OGE70497.1 MAG: hypothetical protein A3J21_00240 [Candidatus Daviesbacteria bacterium RIFCSPLOWO2_02_FULL_43_11]
MIDLSKIIGFQWDKGNVDKSYKKHGITTNEAEEIFVDENVFLVEDLKHPQSEQRLVAIGKSSQGKVLFVVFTVRKDKIRIISVRMANAKERRLYEKT